MHTKLNEFTPSNLTMDLQEKRKKKEIMWMSYLELRACILCTEQKSNEMDGTKKQNEQKI